MRDVRDVTKTGKRSWLGGGRMSACVFARTGSFACTLCWSALVSSSCRVRSLSCLLRFCGVVSRTLTILFSREDDGPRTDLRRRATLELPFSGKPLAVKLGSQVVSAGLLVIVRLLNWSLGLHYF